MSDQHDSKIRRSFFRFRLKSLLALSCLLAVAFSYFGHHSNLYRKEQSTIKALSDGFASNTTRQNLDVAFSQLRGPTTGKDEKAIGFAVGYVGPKWMQSTYDGLGIKMFDRVVAVRVCNPGELDIRHLDNLDQLRKIYMSGEIPSNVTDQLSLMRWRHLTVGLSSRDTIWVK